MDGEKKGESRFMVMDAKSSELEIVADGEVAKEGAIWFSWTVCE
ncbi:hypothetical protein A2U01_0067556 [Trifolium medium]|uniref:Uncharacterized protein n=1 Tax=Trifolium medium TaxID=97028 RepID=A0A392SEN4_9FABA|nr:hypothetical protein [Trifolium medium]